MSDIDEKFTENMPGKYYVSKVCIGCTLCAELAPHNFSANTADDAYDAVICYVCRQPGDSSEEALCIEAMEICPANAIHSDGLELIPKEGVRS